MAGTGDVEANINAPRVITTNLFAKFIGPDTIVENDTTMQIGNSATTSITLDADSVLFESGTEVDFVGADVLNIPYTPTTATDWDGTAPSTIGEAIDRLAALVKTLNSGTGA